MKLKSLIAIILCLCTILHTEFSFSQCGTAGAAGALNVTGANTVVNAYYPAPAGTVTHAAGNNSITVGTRDSRSAASLNIAVGQTIVIMQMQGSDIDATNTTSYGDGTASAISNGYTGANHFAGRYEYNVVTSVSGGTIGLQFGLTLSYASRAWSSTLGKQTYQVIVVPRYTTIAINGAGNSITAPTWNGASGGVVILEASGVATIGVAGAIDVSGKGFRGGGGKTFTGASTGVAVGDLRYNSKQTTSTINTGGSKGEGIAGTPIYVYESGTVTTTLSVEGYVNGSMGRGAPGNAGGGGNDGAVPTDNTFNTGGGGGGNAGAGGQGGSGWHNSAPPANSTIYPYGGFGGAAFAERSISRVVMGGGGGAGTANNATASTPGPGTEYRSSGGAGGGIVIMRASSYAGTGSVLANGVTPIGQGTTTDPTDAVGGGGAGGSIVLVVNSGNPSNLAGVTAQANGAAGGSMLSYFDHGPGGGGGGGFIVSSGALNVASSVTGGAAGETYQTSSTGPLRHNYGATVGSGGVRNAISGRPVFTGPAGSSSGCGVLPITLVSFNGSLRNSDVHLRWETEMETRFSHFEVEYSQDGNTFNNIGRVNATGGPQYSFTHTQPSAINYYRLRLVDTDGSYTFSSIITVRSTTTSSFSVTPLQNPVKFDISARIESDVEESGYYRIIAPNGAVINQKNINVQKGFSIVMFDDRGNRTSGVYTIEVITPSRSAKIRVVRSN